MGVVLRAGMFEPALRSARERARRTHPSYTYSATFYRDYSPENLRSVLSSIEALYEKGDSAFFGLFHRMEVVLRDERPELERNLEELRSMASRKDASRMMAFDRAFAGRVAGLGGSGRIATEWLRDLFEACVSCCGDIFAAVEKYEAARRSAGDYFESDSSNPGYAQAKRMYEALGITIDAGSFVAEDVRAKPYGRALYLASLEDMAERCDRLVTGVAMPLAELASDLTAKGKDYALKARKRNPRYGREGSLSFYSTNFGCFDDDYDD